MTFSQMHNPGPWSRQIQYAVPPRLAMATLSIGKKSFTAARRRSKVFRVRSDPASRRRRVSKP